MNNMCNDGSGRASTVNHPEALIKPELITIFICLFFIMISTDIYGQEKGDPVLGKAAFSKRSCSLCHSINGNGGDVGPDLTNITQKRSEEWLVKWLKDPASIKPDTIMPKIDWNSDQEILDIIMYLKHSGKDKNKDSR